MKWKLYVASRAADKNLYKISKQQHHSINFNEQPDDYFTDLFVVG